MGYFFKRKGPALISGQVIKWLGNDIKVKSAHSNGGFSFEQGDLIVTVTCQALEKALSKGLCKIGPLPPPSVGDIVRRDRFSNSFGKVVSVGDDFFTVRDMKTGDETLLQRGMDS